MSIHAFGGGMIAERVKERKRKERREGEKKEKKLFLAPLSWLGPQTLFLSRSVEDAVPR